jgi:GNAT superfamily N-acetyltransferase
LLAGSGSELIVSKRSGICAGVRYALGYNGSESARRAVDRVRQLALERPTVVIVAVAPEVRSAGLGTDLGEALADVAHVIARNKRTVVVTRCC